MLTQFCRSLKALAILCFLIATLTSTQGAQAQPSASRPIRLVVGYPPGSSSDLMARMLAKSWSEALGVSVVIENKAGASGTLAAASVARAAPDGTTLLYGLQDSQIIFPLLKKDVAYDPQKDFTALAKVAEINLMIAANPASGIKTLQDLIAQAKAKPGSIRFGTSGIGSIHQLSTEMLMQRAGFSMQHVPYQGGVPALTGLLRGDVDVVFASETLLAPQVKANKLVGLATAARKRSPQMANVPTMTQAGIPDFVITAWYGIFGPAGMPPDVVALLEKSLAQALAMPEYQKQLASAGGVVDPLVGKQFDAFMKKETQMYRDVITRGKIKLEGD